jgi:hypothetical protein
MPNRPVPAQADKTDAVLPLDLAVLSESSMQFRAQPGCSSASYAPASLPGHRMAILPE